MTSPRNISLNSCLVASRSRIETRTGSGPTFSSIMMRCFASSVSRTFDHDDKQSLYASGMAEVDIERWLRYCVHFVVALSKSDKENAKPTTTCSSMSAIVVILLRCPYHLLQSASSTLDFTYCAQAMPLARHISRLEVNADHSR